MIRTLIRTFLSCKSLLILVAGDTHAGKKIILLQKFAWQKWIAIDYFKRLSDYSLYCFYSDNIAQITSKSYKFHIKIRI